MLSSDSPTCFICLCSMEHKTKVQICNVANKHHMCLNCFMDLPIKNKCPYCRNTINKDESVQQYE